MPRKFPGISEVVGAFDIPQCGSVATDPAMRLASTGKRVFQSTKGLHIDQNEQTDRLIYTLTSGGRQAHK